MNSRLLACIRFSVVLSIGLTCWGCGFYSAKPVAVDGKVTLDGQPLGNANVSFFAVEGSMPAGMRSVSGKTDASGDYHFEKVFPAEYVVSVTESMDLPAIVPGSKPEMNLVMANPSAGTALAAYQPGTTTLKAQVSEDATNFDFELKSSSATKSAAR